MLEDKAVLSFPQPPISQDILVAHLGLFDCCFTLKYKLP